MKGSPADATSSIDRAIECGLTSTPIIEYSLENWKPSFLFISAINWSVVIPAHSITFWSSLPVFRRSLTEIGINRHRGLLTCLFWSRCPLRVARSFSTSASLFSSIVFTVSVNALLFDVGFLARFGFCPRGVAGALEIGA